MCSTIYHWFEFSLKAGVERSWTTKRSNQSILKIINPEYSLEGLVLKLKLQYLATWCEELTHLKRPWCWERLKVEGEGDWRWDGWMASPTQWTWVWASSGRWWRAGKPGVLQSMGLQRVRHDWANEQWGWYKNKEIFYFLYLKWEILFKEIEGIIDLRNKFWEGKKLFKSSSNLIQRQQSKITNQKVLTLASVRVFHKSKKW